MYHAVARRISLPALKEYPRVPTQLIGWKGYQAKREEYPSLAMVKIMSTLALGPLPHLSEVVRHPL